MDELTELKHLFKELSTDLKEWNEENRNNIIFLADCRGKLQEILTGDGDSKEIEIEQHQDIDGGIQEQQNGHEFDELNINIIINEKEEMGKIINWLYQEEAGWLDEGVDGYEYDDDDLSTSNIDSSYDLILKDRRSKRGIDMQMDQFKKNNYLTRKRVRKKKRKKERGSFPRD